MIIMQVHYRRTLLIDTGSYFNPAKCITTLLHSWSFCFMFHCFPHWGHSQKSLKTVPCKPSFTGAGRKLCESKWLYGIFIHNGKHIMKGRGGAAITFRVNTEIPCQSTLEIFSRAHFRRKKKKQTCVCVAYSAVRRFSKPHATSAVPLPPPFPPNRGENERRTMRSIQPRLAVLLTGLPSRILSLFDFKKLPDCPISGSIFFFRGWSSFGFSGRPVSRRFDVRPENRSLEPEC